MTHACGYELWTVGKAASAELELLAEDGDTSALVAKYATVEGVCQCGAIDEAVPAGGSTYLEVNLDKDCGCITTATMLVGTNDAYTGFLNTPLKAFGGYQPVTALAYDAGTEANTELCKDIPGPPCNAPDSTNNNSNKNAEGFVHVSPGIAGNAEVGFAYDWRAAVLLGKEA